MKEFKGRVLAKGNYHGKVIVSHQGVNTLATFQKSALMNKKCVIASDQNNPDIYNKNITGIALALPKTIGSTTGGMVLEVICSMGINPAALLFSEHIDSLAGAGIVLSTVWENSNIIAIDNLGEDFLKEIKTDDTIVVKDDGTVIIE